MTSVPTTSADDLDEDASSRCWCCGRVDGPERMVHLGDHPEVGLCLACAHFVHQQAHRIEDDARSGPGVLARQQLRKVRSKVIERGWHRNRLVGRMLRKLGRYLP